MIGFAILALVQVASAQDYHGYAVEDYRQTGACCADSSCTNLNQTIDQATAFDDIFDTWQTNGWWTSSTVYTDLTVDPEDWTDGARDTWGNDAGSGGVDYADVGYFSGHGGHDCSSPGLGYSWVTMGENHTGQDCRPESDDSSNDANWLFDDDLEIVILDSCEGMQKCVWNRDGYDNTDGSSLRMIAGFHGTSYDLAGQVGALEDYANNSRLSGAGDNWLEYRAIWWPLPDLDQCPTALVWGSSQTYTDDFYNNGGLDDWTYVGSHTMNTYYYLTNCDPGEGDQL
jgi:hypothetical protein